jgi:U3 small nucleolar RNA-associated protein 11
MMSSTVDSKGRKVHDRGNKALSQGVVKLLKTQDAAYIRTMLQMVRKERQHLEEKILLEGDDVKPLGKDEDEVKKGKHVVFVGDKDEQRKFKVDEWFGQGGEWPQKEKEVVKEDLDDDEEEEDVKPKKPSKKENEAKLLAEKEKRALKKQRERTKERIAIHLKAVKNRERELMIAEDELEKQRAKMNNTIGGVNKNGVKFKLRERKR